MSVAQVVKQEEFEEARDFRKQTIQTQRDITETLKGTMVTKETVTLLELAGINLRFALEQIEKPQTPEKRKEFIDAYDNITREIRRILEKVRAAYHDNPEFAEYSRRVWELRNKDDMS